jgi:hypothetical protein
MTPDAALPFVPDGVLASKSRPAPVLVVDRAPDGLEEPTGMVAPLAATPRDAAQAANSVSELDPDDASERPAVGATIAPLTSAEAPLVVGDRTPAQLANGNSVELPDRATERAPVGDTKSAVVSELAPLFVSA